MIKIVDMKKGYILLFLSIVVLFIAGCTGGSGGTGKFIGGDRALEISYIDQEPPNEVLDNSEDIFDITLRIRNIGEASIPKGKVIATLKGIGQDDFSLSSLTARSDDEIERLQRIADRVTEPDETEINFRNARYKFDLDAAFDIDIRADVCYEYSNVAIADLCLKKDATKRRTGDQCLINNNNVLVENSGGPVKIVSMQQRSSGEDKIKFTFVIETVGIGDVFEPGTFTNVCGVNDDKKDRLTVNVVTRGNIPIDCTKLNGDIGTVDLFSGRRSIRCTADTRNLQDIAFLSRINIVTNYAFKESVHKTITVIDSESF